jgi:hypothetical protein
VFKTNNDPTIGRNRVGQVDREKREIVEDDGIVFTERLLLAAVVPVSSLAGLAALLRSGRTVTKLAVLSALLNSGLFGLASGALLLHHYGLDYPWMIFGICTLAGLGGNSLLEVGLEIIKSWVRNRNE